MYYISGRLFTKGKKHWYPLDRRLDGPKADLKVVEKRKKP
jgi:hypothetical protein